MNTVKSYLAGAGVLAVVVAALLAVGTFEKRDRDAEQAERIAKFAEYCRQRTGVIVQDINGKMACAPRLLLSYPVASK